MIWYKGLNFFMKTCRSLESNKIFQFKMRSKDNTIKEEYPLAKFKIFLSLLQWIKSKKLKIIMNLLEKKEKEEIVKCLLIKEKFKKNLILRKVKKIWWEDYYNSKVLSKKKLIVSGGMNNANKLFIKIKKIKLIKWTS